MVFCIFFVGLVSAQEDTVQIQSASYDVETEVEMSYFFSGQEDEDIERTEGETASDIQEEMQDIAVYSVDQTDEEIPPYTIFGRDDRSIIYFSPTNRPFSTVTRITTSQGSCSGFMIGKHYVATAAHCLYDKYQGWAKNIKVCPAYANGDSAYGCSTGIYSWIMDTNMNRIYDVGVIKVDCSLGSYTGWLGNWVISDSQTDDYALLLGYASDKNMNYMFSTYGYLDGTSNNGNLLKYKMDTLPGSSGGPVIMSYNGDWFYVVGINVSQDNQYNYSVRFTKTVEKFLSDFWGK